MRSWRFASSAFAVALFWAGMFGADKAHAQMDAFSPASLHGVVDLRASAANGEPSFRDDGFGKSRFGGAGTDAFHGDLRPAFVALEWRPHLTWNVGAVVDVIYQPHQERSIDLGQAYLTFKPLPVDGVRFQARAGLFYPPISQENDGTAWTPRTVITPSAIASWVGEETKVAGVEVSALRKVGDQSLGATLGAFGDDDTAGTLLALRGWSLSDYQSQLRGGFNLPPLNSHTAAVQGGETYSLRELDRRVGWYGRLDWRPVPEAALFGLYWNNLGDMTTRSADRQWAWATDFWSLGASWDVNDRTRLLAQAMTGRTAAGWAGGHGRYANARFDAAYLLVERRIGSDTASLRADLFDVHDRARAFFGDTSEHGWASTADWRHPLNRVLDLRLEALYIDSDRPSRIWADEAPAQRQTVLQSSLRLSF